MGSDRKRSVPHTNILVRNYNCMSIYYIYNIYLFDIYINSCIIITVC